MSADTLRKAAALMRERAEGAQATFDANVESVVVPIPPEAAELLGHYFAFQPAVALAVADWLDDVAANWDIAQYGSWSLRALTVAHAFLGESA